jgi:hypothetical protein
LHLIVLLRAEPIAHKRGARASQANCRGV